MSASAFGVDHGDINKGLGDAARKAKAVGELGVKAPKETAQLVGQSFKLGRQHRKLANADYGVKEGFAGSFKQGFKYGKEGRSATYRRAVKGAKQQARTSARDDVTRIASGQRPRPISDRDGGFGIDSAIYRLRD